MPIPLLVALAVAPASAEPVADTAAGDCAPATVEDSRPLPGAQGVPVDVHPVLYLATGPCGLSAWNVEMFGPDGSSVYTVSHDLSQGRVLEIDPGDDLLPASAYLIRVEPGDGVGEIVEIGFTTGEAPAAGVKGSPAITELTASGWQIDVDTTFLATVTPAADPDNLSRVALQVVGDLGAPTEWTAVDNGNTLSVSTTRYFGAAGEEVCLVAIQRDAAGVDTASKEACVVIEAGDPADEAKDLLTDCGCGTARGTPLLALVGALAAVRGRRARSSAPSAAR